ncbi:hypothetical protein DL98DRAFT_540914 [Cadophora sp. DSE1049]|nr:hypothetical protein DL98DRAFT_540914 [Cadophora sp. DSE1049]
MSEAGAGAGVGDRRPAVVSVTITLFSAAPCLNVWLGIEAENTMRTLNCIFREKFACTNAKETRPQQQPKELFPNYDPPRGLSTPSTTSLTKFDGKKRLCDAPPLTQPARHQSKKRRAEKSSDSAKTNANSHSYPREIDTAPTPGSASFKNIPNPDHSTPPQSPGYYSPLRRAVALESSVKDQFQTSAIHEILSFSSYRFYLRVIHRLQTMIICSSLQNHQIQFFVANYTRLSVQGGR